VHSPSLALRHPFSGAGRLYLGETDAVPTSSRKNLAISNMESSLFACWRVTRPRASPLFSASQAHQFLFQLMKQNLAAWQFFGRHIAHKLTSAEYSHHEFGVGCMGSFVSGDNFEAIAAILG
jgi:hypothetical protein